MMPSMRRVLFKPRCQRYARTNSAMPREARYTFPTCTTAETKPSGLPAMKAGELIQGTDNFFIVPTPDTLAGDFTQPIIDPATGAAFAGCAANGVNYVSCIPQSRWSRLANAWRSPGTSFLLQIPPVPRAISSSSPVLP